MPALCTRFLLSLINQCKLRFYVYVPCFAVGLGIALIYYKIRKNSTDNNSSQPPNELNEAQIQDELNEARLQDELNEPQLQDELNEPQLQDELNEARLQDELREEAAKENILMLHYINLGNSSLEMKAYEDAVGYYTKYLLLCPQSDRLLKAHVYHNRATAYYNMELLNECLADCDEILEYLPTNKDTLFLRARVLIGMKNLELAAEDATIFLLTKDNELHTDEDVTYAFFVISAFGKMFQYHSMKH
ncbi:Tetratricopeptide repeat,Tetratricopeptide repeat-containing domain,Tetratricopeptide-like helical [Cinara cedri]|uniref:Tetratricopeptide repeat,Tetratricopeptide repeat-containing domain,Tetratricopeptide-like helical n=1 Tax=Cinara cedri TaxID=506608 RepID=A0A5E4M6V3_9HEMI|nr:Tetratricopeptide repeat,Tetratricopeptide repeat-containing domain,Tetratricopeptide-like helical [Cinara cedri]